MDAFLRSFLEQLSCKSCGKQLVKDGSHVDNSCASRRCMKCHKKHCADDCKQVVGQITFRGKKEDE